jgi:NADPH-dependent curcumin reductase CurA
MPILSREVHLIARPDGMPNEEQFDVIEQSAPDPNEGEVVVKNLYMSVDPAMRPPMTNGQTPLNKAMMGAAVGRVIHSRNAALKEGDIVQSRFGFREYFTAPGEQVAKMTTDPALPLTAYMHVLGGAGFVAYGGLIEIGKMKAGEQVFVSTAAGAVGSAAVQIAKLKGCTVIGSTGSDKKCRWLKEQLGVDEAINYKTEPIRQALKAKATKGIDVYFDNVGGDHLDAALPRMNLLGRIAVCGMISAYNTFGAVSAPVTTLSNIIYGRVNIRGFVATDFPHLRQPFEEEMTHWLKEGKVKYQETIMDGIQNAPRAFIGLLNGTNTGKMLVRLGE